MPGSSGLSRHLLGDRWIEMSNVFPKVESGHKDWDTENQKGHLVLSKGPWPGTRVLRACHYLMGDPSQVTSPFWASVSPSTKWEVRLCFLLSLPEQIFQDSLRSP